MISGVRGRGTMEKILLILIAVLVCLVIGLYQTRRMSKQYTEKHMETINSQKEKIRSVEQENKTAREQLTKQAQDIASLQNALKELERRLAFYTNIEEDSNNLNVQEDEKEHAELVEKAVQQIQSAKAQPKGAEYREKTLLDYEQAAIYDELERGSGNLFITGKAGTGKSFLLDVFRKTTNKKHIVLAPTGIAALNVGGVTLHSTFGYRNLVNLDIDNISEETIQLNSQKRKILKNVSTIVIDEISMVRADTFEKIDRILKTVNENEKPFGGKQILLFGDLFQLPPVVQQKEREYLIDRFGGIFFFFSDAYKQGNFKFHELTINHRQKDDTQYFELLNRVREGKTTQNDIAVLNSRVVQDQSVYDRFVTLLPTKAEVEGLNRYHINQLDSQEFVYHTEVLFNKYPDQTRNLEAIFPITNILKLKKGALVMMVANDPEHRWVNGTLGIVSRLTRESVSVAIDGREYDVHPFEFSEQDIKYENGRIFYEDVLRVRQYPVVLAYAMTIHKSQGQTYRDIVCDIERCFADGQAYVALSRCSSLQGLHLKSSIKGSSIRADRSVLDFYRANTNSKKV